MPDKAEFNVNDCAESLKTGRRGVIQASYPNGKFLLFHGQGYEHLQSEEMKHIEPDDVPFRVDLYLMDITTKDN